MNNKIIKSIILENIEEKIIIPGKLLDELVIFNKSTAMKWYGGEESISSSAASSIAIAFEKSIIPSKALSIIKKEFVISYMTIEYLDNTTDFYDFVELGDYKTEICESDNTIWFYILNTLFYGR